MALLGRNLVDALVVQLLLGDRYLDIMLSIMRRDWLGTPIGINAVAIGLVAIMFSLAVFAVQGFSILLTGKPYALHVPSGSWYLLWAAIAVVFSSITGFISRPGLPRIVIGLFSISMASHILEQFVTLPVHQLKSVAACRILVTVALIFLVFRYRSITSSGKS